ncbi:MAG: NAD(P)-dependent oxidoreductase [Verrucomicrobiae bacterium]|nr:NAD(P)-dependent oxidoreductase [Verrucomicrobiae bacterium]
MAKQSILITGVNGLVGSCVYRHLSSKPDRFEVFGMDLNRKPSKRVHPNEAVEIPESHFYQTDLSNPNLLAEAFQDKDTVVHLAADPNGEAPWESVLKNNIVGSYHVFEASKRAKVRRVIYASSIQVSFGYLVNVEPYKSIRVGDYGNVPDTFERISADHPAWPINLYGSSKVFGETLARIYSSTTPMSCICLRLGGVYSLDQVPPLIVPNGCTRKDVSRLVECCIQAPDTLKFDVFYGLSDCDYRWTDIERASNVIGYTPEDRIYRKV